MSAIRDITAWEVLDSRGNPTLCVQVETIKGHKGIASVPSGASTGENEAVEKRDGDKKRFQGKGVKTSVTLVETLLKERLIGMEVEDQIGIDQLLISLDGTENKKKLGGNSLLGVSLAACRAGASELSLPLYRYLGGAFARELPCPMLNILNGGMHADNALQFQEFMIIPHGTSHFKESLRMGVEVFWQLKTILKEKGLSTCVGDEGGFAPVLSSNEEAIELILQAIEKAKYKPGEEIGIALDCAACSFYSKGKYDQRDTKEQISYLKELQKRYPILSIEDGLDENDWQGWVELSKQIPCQLVGDDLFVTNKKFLQKGIELGAANAILIKPNQIGTLTETIETIALAKREGYKTVISHRSGETEDTTISDLAVALSIGQIKTGAPCRGERTAKYNRLLTIEHELSSACEFAHPF